MSKFIKEENKDSFGHDFGYFPDKTIDELKEITENIREAVAFNSLGYVKTHVGNAEEIGHICDLYVNEEKISNIVNEQKSIALGNIKKDITFAITSCKRLMLFIQTMNNFLYNCKDIYRIKKWICIDDNSSEKDRDVMTKMYPFFEFIFKNENEKGHAKSLNMIFDKVDTKYLLLFEDDWKCSLPFNISYYIEFLENTKYDQILFHTRIPDHELHKFKNVYNINNKYIYEYSYFYNCPLKKTLNGPYHANFLRIEKELDIVNKANINATHGFHHPGFSLNPSIMDLDKIKSYNIRFKEETKFNDCFELYFAFQCLINKFNVVFTKIKIEHSGYFNSSYILNDMKRSFD
jgi:hypothetical protein